MHLIGTLSVYHTNIPNIYEILFIYWTEKNTSHIGRLRVKTKSVKSKIARIEVFRIKFYICHPILRRIGVI